MEGVDLVQMVSSVGFPIVCCFMLCWYVWKQGQSHKEEIDAIRKSLDDNTLIITRLVDKMDVFLRGVEDHGSD